VGISVERNERIAKVRREAIQELSHRLRISTGERVLGVRQTPAPPTSAGTPARIFAGTERRIPPPDAEARRLSI
jgi:hypothetical protein